MQIDNIVSDVGFARNVITEQDIGIIIPNTYKTIHEMVPSGYLHCSGNEVDDTNLTALSEEWRVKAKKGNKILINMFNAKQMSEQYLILFIALLKG